MSLGTAENSATREEFTSRTVGVLPEGSRVRRINQNTETKINYGNEVWTIGQTVRDIFQNHLDANTEKFVDELLAKILDPSSINIDTPEKFDALNEIIVKLVTYKKVSANDSSIENENRLNSFLYSNLNVLAERAGAKLNPNITDRYGNININLIRKEIKNVTETPPQIQFKIVDQESYSKYALDEWVSYEELRDNPKYKTELRTGNLGDLRLKNLRFQVQSVRILDKGTGYDSKLTSFYKSTKKALTFLRGKFGEGAKMSEVQLIRNGAKVRTRSVFNVNGNINKTRAWKQRGEVEDNKIVNKGVEIEVPQKPNQRYGSATEIDIEEANKDFKQSFLENLDPRSETGGIAKNCLDYTQEEYLYANKYDDLTGVSITETPKNQYVMGLRVLENGVTTNLFEPLFSYDFRNSDLLRGRDRNEINYSKMYDLINTFWGSINSLKYARVLVERCLTKDKESSDNYFEYRPLNDIIIGQIISNKEVRKEVIETFARIVGFEATKLNVVIKQSDVGSKSVVLAKIESLRKLGVNVCIVNADISNNSVKALSEYYKGIYEISDYESFLKSKEYSKLIQTVEETREYTKPINLVYLDAIHELVEVFGLKYIDRATNFDIRPLYVENYGEENAEAVELIYQEATDKFRIQIRPQLMIVDGKIPDNDVLYWKRKFQMELMALHGQEDKDLVRNSALINSQELVNNILDNSIAKDKEFLANFPTQIEHTPGEIIISDEGKKQENPDDLSREELTMFLFDTVSKLELSSNELKYLVDLSKYVIKEKENSLFTRLKRRIVIENGEVSYVIEENDNNSVDRNLVFRKQKLEDLKILSEYDGNKVYQLEDKVFTKWDCPKRAIISPRYTDSTFVINNGKILEVGKFEATKYQYSDRKSLVAKPCINNECISMEMPSSDYNTLLATDTALELLKQYEAFIPVKAERENKPPKLSGVIETTLSIDYGEGEWDNPIRVFEDALQNHADVNSDRKVEQRYEVKRGEERVWVSEEELGQEDKIIGYEVSNKGKGYNPNDIAVIGNTDKSDDILTAGKYGEGQKMLAAACVRNGIDIEYSSTCEVDGKEYRWKATASQVGVNLIIKGNNKKASKVVFNIQSENINHSEESIYTSYTRISLPDEKVNNDPTWDTWISIIDPRVKDDNGRGGMERYIIDLRKDRKDIIDLGFVKILLNENGIYENGLFIADSYETILGYSVPSITNGRDRNTYDSKTLKKYIYYALTECRDPKVLEALFTKFKLKYSKSLSENESGISLEEKELEFITSASEINSRPIWKEAFRKILPGSIVYSKSYFESIKKEAIGKLSSLNPDQKEVATDILFKTVINQREEYMKLRNANFVLANIEHIPPSKRINIQESDYQYWSKLFPNAEDELLKLSKKEVKIPENEYIQIANLISLCALQVKQAVDSLNSSMEGYELLDRALAFKPALDPMFGNKSEDLLLLLEKWSDAKKIVEEGLIFVSPSDVNYLGSADNGKLGINERLLTNFKPNEFASVVTHELVHLLFDSSDYTKEFIVMMIELSSHYMEKVKKV